MQSLRTNLKVKLLECSCSQSVAKSRFVLIPLSIYLSIYLSTCLSLISFSISISLSIYIYKSKKLKFYSLLMDISIPVL